MVINLVTTTVADVNILLAELKDRGLPRKAEINDRNLPRTAELTNRDLPKTAELTERGLLRTAESCLLTSGMSVSGRLKRTIESEMGVK